MKDMEEEVWSAISAFEQILEAMPNDRASLEALSHAYEQIGDLTRAKEYLVRLGNVLLDEADVDAAGELLEKLRPHIAEDPEAKELVGRIEELGPSQLQSKRLSKVEEMGTAGPPMGYSAPTFNMADELSFAWSLMEANQITQEEYASVVQDLTEMSTGETDATVSVLHVLESRQFKHLDRIVGCVAQEHGTPIVTLSSFDLQYEAVSLLADDFMTTRGAMVFELLSKHALAVVMNPSDKQLLNDVISMAQRPCHFFLTLPSEFDRALIRAKDIVAARREQEQRPPQ